MRHAVLLLFVFSLTSCATARLQPQVDSLVVSQKPSQAYQILEGHPPTAYGKRNELLYWLDKGMTAHLAGRYNESIAAFSAADKKYDELYTRSLTQMSLSWVLNDNTQDYRGDDQEYVLISIFQALNFAVLGNLDEALVEVRRIDQKLKLISGVYSKAQRHNFYHDDAFARFLSGVLWQATGTNDGLNDAYIAYSKALKLYQDPPLLLRLNWEATKAFMDWGKRPPSDKAEIYVIEYTGFAPTKEEGWILLPLDYGHVTKLAFPEYRSRFSAVHFSVVSATQGNHLYFEDTQAARDIGEIARQILDNHKAWMLAKGTLRPLAKYAAGKAGEVHIRKQYGDLAAALFGLASNIFNIATEQADLRSWQTLPGHIRIARIVLPPGTYDFAIEDLDQHKVVVEKRSLGRLTLGAGQTQFLVTRGYR